MRFPGQRFDPWTGSNYNYFRNYDASAGRYLQSDPIGMSGGINTYAYVSSNPMSGIDPFGLEGPGSFNNGGTRVSWENGSGRAPDYASVTVNLGLGNLHYTLSRSGKLFSGGGFAGDPRNLGASLRAVGFSIVVGWVDDCPETPSEAHTKVDGFLSGPSFNVSGFNGAGGGMTVNSSGTATEIGVGTRSVGVGTTYSGEAARVGAGW